jgi:hypothetical protein
MYTDVLLSNIHMPDQDDRLFISDIPKSVSSHTSERGGPRSLQMYGTHLKSTQVSINGAFLSTWRRKVQCTGETVIIFYIRRNAVVQ